jgi:hypothetical protein
MANPGEAIGTGNYSLGAQLRNWSMTTVETSPEPAPQAKPLSRVQFNIMKTKALSIPAVRRFAGSGRAVG